MQRSRFSVDWPRILQALEQYARSADKEISAYEMETIVYILECLYWRNGIYTQSRVNMINLGKNIIQNNALKILVPVCPDYGYESGKYTFDSMGRDTSLLASSQLVHLNYLLQALTKEVSWKEKFVHIQMVYADTEANDARMLERVGETKSSALQKISHSARATDQLLNNSCTFPSSDVCVSTSVSTLLLFIGEARFEALRLQALPFVLSHERQIESDTLARANLYKKIHPGMDFKEMRDRTIYTASQYVAIGTFALEEGYTICNHSTSNLSWYLKLNVPLLHSPISVYEQSNQQYEPNQMIQCGAPNCVKS